MHDHMPVFFLLCFLLNMKHSGNKYRETSVNCSFDESIGNT